MATLTQLVKTVAKVEGLDPATVGLIARNVREAKLITTRGRGVSAAVMDATDAANLLIAVNASNKATDALTALRTFSRLKVEHNKEVDRDLTFGNALKALLEAAVNRSFPERYMSCPSPPKIMQSFGEGEVQAEISFYKPGPRAVLKIGIAGEIRITRQGLFFDNDVITTDAEAIEFFFAIPNQPLNKKTVGDQKNTTSISFSTIRAVAHILRQK
jgi:hypothetical protein